MVALNDRASALSLFMLEHIADDGHLTVDEYRQAFNIALAQGELKEKDRRILTRLFSLLPPQDITPEIQQHIVLLRDQYNL